MTLVALLLLSETPAAAQDFDENPARVMTMLGEQGQRLLVTGLPLHQGDRFIDPANDLWQVVRLDGSIAVARRVAKLARSLSPGELALLRQPGMPFTGAALTQAGPVDVVIYHSHSDESYIPGDGTDSIPGRGGIYGVGAALVTALRREGISAAQRLEIHNPHDNLAYMRSRRTATDALFEETPRVLFDIHRDAAPGREYQLAAGGQQFSRVMIVIGGANPAYQGNLAFARLLKGQADELQPGLIRGIYIGRGTYNQDIYTRNILLEVGSQETPRGDAERGAALLASAIVPLLAAAGPARSVENRAAGWNILWLLGAVVLLGGGALTLISGGVRPAIAKLANWRTELWDPRKRR